MRIETGAATPSAPSARRDGTQTAAPPGADVARAVAEVVRITLLDDAGREDMRSHLARRHVAARLGFAALRAAEACPPPPTLAGRPHPGAASGTARYRAVAAATGAALPLPTLDLST